MLIIPVVNVPEQGMQVNPSVAAGLPESLNPLVNPVEVEVGVRVVQRARNGPSTTIYSGLVASIAQPVLFRISNGQLSVGTVRAQSGHLLPSMSRRGNGKSTR